MLMSHTGGVMSDVAHAAVAIERGCEWVSRDGDFTAFENHGFRWRRLLPN